MQRVEETQMAMALAEKVDDEEKQSAVQKKGVVPDKGVVSALRLGLH
jgi:hypothetical protein